MIKYFTKTEWILWFLSIALISASYVFWGQNNLLTYIASLIGVTSLIFNAKGNPFGQVLMIAFSILYGVISLSCAYYGEMITYLGMTAPMALFALVSWLRNPYKGNKKEVEVGTLKKGEKRLITFLTFVVTVVFYFILKYLGTANMFFSTLSVTTSFVAAYLTFRRSAYFALAYALNDIVLIVMWIMAAISDGSYISVIVCFIVFLANDLYGFYNWRRIRKKQKSI